MARTSSTETAIKNMLIPLVQAIGRSGKLIYILILLIVGFLVYQFFTKSSESSTVEYNSALIEKQIKSVFPTHSKLDKKEQNKISNCICALADLLFFDTPNFI